MQAQAAQKKKGTGAIRAFFSYYKPHRGLFAIDLVCSFTIAACNLVYPGVARVIMNDLVPNKQLGLILLWAGILLAVYVLKAAAHLYRWLLGPCAGGAHPGGYAARVFQPCRAAALFLLRTRPRRAPSCLASSTTCSRRASSPITAPRIPSLPSSASSARW